MNSRGSIPVLLLLSVCLIRPCALSADPSAGAPEATANPVRVARIDYRGWSGSVLLSNGLVEAVVVPVVGRVMQFRFAAAKDGPFWENPAQGGRPADSGTREWANFGGDKAWPSPQSDWPRLISHSWPPPIGFDGMPMEVVIDGTAVVLISPVDPAYGVRVRRRVELSAGRPVMTITTRYEKMSGQPAEIGVWTITQVKDPVAVHVLLRGGPCLHPGYVRLSDQPPPSLTLAAGSLSLTRDPVKSHKIGVRSGTLVAIGLAEILRIDSAPVAGAKYPDGGSSAEVYTQPDPMSYVELEMLGPLETVRTGDAIERVTTYTLEHRVTPSPGTEIERLLKP